MNKEFEFLNIIKQTLCNSSYLGDDCAYLDEYKLAVSADSLIEDVHFSLHYMTPYEIAQKALLVNISDILASGAKAEYAIITLGGVFDDNFIKDFYKGLNDTACAYGVKIIGGDLVKAQKIAVSITIFGNYRDCNISSRKNAKEGYIIAVAGEFGSSAKGLEDLQNGIKDNYFIQYHKKPLLYPEISQKIAKTAGNPYAMMDCSDNLADCLIQICDKSTVSAEINWDKIPRKIEEKEKVLYGGEDYSLVVFLHSEDFRKIPELKQIGICKKGTGVFMDGKRLEYKGFKHFD